MKGEYDSSMQPLPKEKIMKNRMLEMFALIVMGAALAVSSFTQDRSGTLTPADKYMISAKAGGVNYVEGDVTVLRKIGRSGPLLRRDELEIGDRVSTGVNGKAEVLLNPGSFLRLGPNSTFQFRSTSLDDLQIAFVSGSAIFEVFATDHFTVSVFAPKDSLAFVETGVYRVDIAVDGTGTVAVTDGKAEIGEYPVVVVGKGTMASIGTSNNALAKFDRGKRDELAEWSRVRSKDLTKMSASSLRSPGLYNALAGSFNNGGCNMLRSFGVWVTIPRTLQSMFLPCGSNWSSPYGFGYGYGLDWYYFPRYYQPPINNNPVRGTEAQSVRPVDKYGQPSQRPSQDSLGPPPYKQVERTRDSVGDFGSKGISPGFNPREGSGPMNGSSGSPAGAPVTTRPSDSPPPQRTKDNPNPIDH